MSFVLLFLLGIQIWQLDIDTMFFLLLYDATTNICTILATKISSLFCQFKSFTTFVLTIDKHFVKNQFAVIYHFLNKNLSK